MAKYETPPLFFTWNFFYQNDSEFFFNEGFLKGSKICLTDLSPPQSSLTLGENLNFKMNICIDLDVHL